MHISVAYQSDPPPPIKNNNIVGTFFANKQINYNFFILHVLTKKNPDYTTGLSFILLYNIKSDLLTSNTIILLQEMSFRMI